MKKDNHINFLGKTVIIVSVWLFLGGCASKPRQPERLLGSPAHHVLNGFKLIKKERFDSAKREFELALELDHQYAPAHRGLGLVYGMKNDFRPAYHSMRKAIYCAKKREDRGWAHLGFIGSHTRERDEVGSGDAQKSFSSSRSFIKEMLDSYYHMGVAYKYGYGFKEYKESMEKVLGVNKAFLAETEGQFRVVKKIEQAVPGSEIGKSMAFLEHVTRAELAALLMKELGLGRFLKMARVKEKHGPSKAVALPPDVKNHPFKEDIEMIIKLNLKGLSVFKDGFFSPNLYIVRADYAMIIADIIARKEKDRSLAKRYVGRRSPFKDVRNDESYFNAVMVCSDRDGIMEAKNGFFNPMAKVSGVDALLIIRKLEDALE